MTLFKECPGSKRIKKPFPEEIKCVCGHSVEIWSDETSTICRNCKREVTRKMLPSCLDWCSMAKECVGGEKYKKYLQSKTPKKPCFKGCKLVRFLDSLINSYAIKKRK